MVDGLDRQGEAPLGYPQNGDAVGWDLIDPLELRLVARVDEREPDLLDSPSLVLRGHGDLELEVLLLRG
jgi:hypothetical protein